MPWIGGPTSNPETPEVDEGDNQSGYPRVTSAHASDVYGNTLDSSGTSASSHKFVGGLGHTTDSDTGLTYMRARYYDPAVGRFASEDPGRQGANWYAYCGNNPVNALDPTGQFWQIVIAVILLAVVVIGLIAGFIDMCRHGDPAYEGWERPDADHIEVDPTKLDIFEYKQNPSKPFSRVKQGRALDRINDMKKSGTFEQKIGGHYAEILIYENIT